MLEEPTTADEKRVDVLLNFRWGVQDKIPSAVLSERLGNTPCVAVPDPPPTDDRNAGTCFGLTPVDEARLAELILFMRGIGLLTKYVSAERDPHDYAIITMTFCQAKDCRLPPEFWDTHQAFGGQPKTE